MLKNTNTSYSIITRVLHWTISIMMIVIIACGFYMSDLEPSDDKWALYAAHKATGVVILALVLIRVVNRLMNIVPKLPDTVPTWQVKLSSGNILLLYLTMLLMPLSGLFGSLLGGYDVAVFGLFTIKALEQNKEISAKLWWIHHQCPWLLMFCIALHICGGLYHHFILKDNVLMRMIRGS